MKIDQEVYGLKKGTTCFNAEDYVGEYHGKDHDIGSYKEHDKDEDDQ